MNEKLFAKYFHGRCSTDEIQEILKWIKEESHGLSDHLIVEQIWKDYLPEEKFNEEKYERMLDKVHHLINLSQSGNPAEEKRVPVIKFLFSISKVLTRVAAILFIPLLLLFISFYNKSDLESVKNDLPVVDTIEIMAPIGSRTYVRLSDSTEVHLNHGSKLRYPQKFIGDNRKVSLEGEAFFTVSHNPEKPFIVETGSLVITALGTKFNIMSYPDDSYIETTLVSGKVNVKKKDSPISLSGIREMETGHHLRYFPSRNTYSYQSVDPGKYISWKHGVLIFKNDPLQEITSRLGRWYNVEFVFRNESVKEFPYTATFVDETLPQILDLLKLATPISYEMTSRIKLPDGTFSKPKVFIDIKRN